jgi:hypothetical protein
MTRTDPFVVTDPGPLMRAVHRLHAMTRAVHMTHVHTPTAQAYLEHAVRSRRVWSIGAYIVVVDTGPEWWSKDSFLFEELIIRDTNPSDDTWALADVLTEALPQLARDYGCVGIVCGDAQRGLMDEKYLAAGYARTGSQFYKEV